MLSHNGSTISKTSNAELRSSPSLYTVEMRIRGNKVRVYSGAAYTLRFTATITAESGYVGFMAEKGVVCDLLRLDSHELALACGSDYKMKVVPHDLNVRFSRMHLGDADGFSIMYYSDVDSIVYWANEAAYTYGLSGIAIWSLG